MAEATLALEGKTVLVTGAASGIGRSIAELLAARGARVVAADRDLDGCEAVVAAIEEAGGRAHCVRVDVADPESVREMVEAAEAAAGRLHCAINNAGVEHDTLPTAECTLEHWDRTLDINLKGTWLCLREEIQHMVRHGGGHIINMASVAGLRAAPLMGPYAASKHGVVGLTRTVAVEYAKAGIRCNAICPGFTRTPMFERASAQLGEERAAKLERVNPLRRPGKPEEIAGVAAWLCSDDCEFINGETITVDGGMTA